MGSYINGRIVAAEDFSYFVRDEWRGALRLGGSLTVSPLPPPHPYPFILKRSGVMVGASGFRSDVRSEVQRFGGWFEAWLFLALPSCVLRQETKQSAKRELLSTVKPRCMSVLTCIYSVAGKGTQGAAAPSDS